MPRFAVLLDIGHIKRRFILAVIRLICSLQLTTEVMVSFKFISLVVLATSITTSTASVHPRSEPDLLPDIEAINNALVRVPMYVERWDYF